MATAKVDLKEFNTLTEGKATILFPKDQVFYNPAQVFNRDLSVATIRTWSENLVTKRQLRKAAWEHKRRKLDNEPDPENIPADTTDPTKPPVETESPVQAESSAADVESNAQRKITIIEALSATGLRAIRYALEIPLIKTVYANDFSPSAHHSIKRNLTHHSLGPPTVIATLSDANALMYAHSGQNAVDVVDLDPYGSAAGFVDAAVQSVAGDGLLCVTCTDMTVLAGRGYPEKCFALYGGSGVKQQYTHETVCSSFVTSPGVGECVCVWCVWMDVDG